MTTSNQNPNPQIRLTATINQDHRINLPQQARLMTTIHLAQHKVKALQVINRVQDEVNDVKDTEGINTDTTCTVAREFPRH